MPFSSTVMDKVLGGRPTKMERAKAPISIRMAKIILPNMIEVTAIATAIIPTPQNQSALLCLCSYSCASHFILKDGRAIDAKIISYVCWYYREHYVWADFSSPRNVPWAGADYDRLVSQHPQGE